MEKSVGDQAKDIGIGLAKDLFTTADVRRTLRTVFGTLLGKKERAMTDVGRRL